ncbi:MAG: adenylate/guanylate cyclase domain-containing protein [Pseudomonadota bacterium]
MSWSIAPVIDWLMHKGRHLPTREAVVGGICERVRAAGMPIDRVAFFFWTLHPQYYGVALFWDGEKVTLNHGEHGFQNTEMYRNSPAARIAAGERVIRRRLEERGCALDFPVLRELRDQSMTDYVMAEVLFSGGVRNSVSLTTRRAGGFSDHDIEEIQRLLHPFALVMENFNSRDLARTLLETYLGRISGSRVLDGQIKRGDGEELDAVIWFSDLRDSTPLARSLGERRFLELLNDYFESTAGAVLEHGGEVLRFIGDASLAVFPTASATAREACECAVAAARTVRARTVAANSRRQAAGLPPFACGVGLHLGRVLYGNIGTPSRLEFSVIGAAANEAARIEALCKETGRDVVLSGAVAAALGEPCASLGRFALRGVAQPVEIFALP